MTLNERFTKYLKKGMEQDAAKNKKSPEIHRLVPQTLCDISGVSQISFF